MAEIIPSRNQIFTEEISYKKGVTENTWTKFGGSINHINTKHYETKSWTLNGIYTAQVILGLDGLWPVYEDIEVLFFGMSTVGKGSSGITEVDLKRLTTPGGSAVSIFSTTPKFTSAGPNDQYLIKDILTPANDVTPAGGTLPVFSTTDLDQGDAIRFDMLTAMVGASNFLAEIAYRPR